jgi:glycosyltransferase involved in cell wall biosynthesis
VRVFLLTETYYPVAGGGETQARVLAEGLAASGWSVTVVTRRSDRALPARETCGWVTIYRLPPAGGGRWRKWGLLVTAVWALWALRGQYDLVLVSGFRIVGLAAVLVSRWYGKVCILKADSLGEMSGDFFTAGLAQVGLKPSALPFIPFLRLRNAALRRADAFIAISTAVADELLASGIPTERIRFIPNSVDLSRFQPLDEEARSDLRRRLALPADEQVVVYTGRLVSYKGLTLLLEVWRRIQARFPGSRLLLVGEGGLDMHNCEAELRAFVAEHDLRATVSFAGRVDNVHQYLQAADIFVFPTENEAFGISLLEAMACGLAVIGTAVGGVRDLICHNQNGLLIPPCDGPALEQALHTLLADPSRRTALGQAALAAVQGRYAEPAVVAQYTTLFSEIVSQNET